MPTPSLVCSYRKRSLGCFAILALGFVALGVSIAVGGDPTGIVLGLITIAFFGTVLVSIFRRLAWRGPVVRIDEDGFFDVRLGPSVIPWHAIRSARVAYGKGGYSAVVRFISLDVENPEAYVPQSRVVKVARKFSKLYGEAGLGIETSTLDHSPQEILQAIVTASKGALKLE